MSTSDLRLYRVASLTLVNAMLFQEILSRTKPVATLRQTLESPDLVDKFSGEWKTIEVEVDFVPIFRIARQVLLSLPATPETYEALRRLADSAIKISRNRVALRHDLMGRIFHRLLADSKFYGAFYTKIPSATLLLGLAINGNSWRVDWSDPKSVGQLQISDLACGTGTLLKAAIEALVDRHVEQSAENGTNAHPDEIHRNLVENSLWGFDLLSSAVHLAASAIAMHDPNIAVKTMHIYSLPLGGSQQKLGSIEFAMDSSLNIQDTLIGASTGPEEATTRKKMGIAVPRLDICTMNPPFTRSVNSNLLFGGVAGAERSDLQAQLQRIVKEKGLKANITAGLGSVFVAIADRMLKDNGVMALVLPKAVLSGLSWEPTRTLLEKYHLQFVICSHEPNNWNFSESTELSETLLVLKKGKSSTKRDTVFVNLWRQPRSSVEALAILRELRVKHPADLERTSGTCEIKTDGQKFGEASKVSLEKNKGLSWALPAAFAQTDLCRMAFNLSKGRIFLPGFGTKGSIKTVALSSVATLGPDGRDIYDGFNLTDSRTTYPAFWGYDKGISKLSQAPNQYLAPLTTPPPGRHLRDANLLWGRAGTLMLPKELWLTTNRVASVVLENDALSNVWWPTRWKSEDEEERLAMERRLALWFNSTLGLFSMLMQREETRGAWIKFPKGWYEPLQVLDLVSLSKSQKRELDKLWSRISDKQLLPFPDIHKDQVRAEIDDVFSKILELPSFNQLREMLSREPMISMVPLD